MTREALIRRRLVDLLDALLARYEAGRPAPQAYRPSPEEVRIRAWLGRDLPPLATDDACTMNEVVDALARLDSGTYGRCEICGDTIGYQRLLDLPATSLCEECARDEGWRPARSPA